MTKRHVLILVLIFVGSLAFGQNKIYRIEKGESVEDIIEKFNLERSELMKLNPDLDSGKLQGKIIVLPAREADINTPQATGIQFKEYKVKRKETLYGLAKENGITVEDIIHYNPYLEKAELGENDMIRLPIFEKENTDFNASVQSSTFRNIVHVVMPKETKYGISKIYQMTVEELDSLNPQIDGLQPGQVLRVINQTSKIIEENYSSHNFSFYTVQPKETLYSLTRELEISQDSLEKLNPILKQLGLQAGMELKIPNKDFSINPTQITGTTIHLKDFISNKSRKEIAIMLPFNLYKVNDKKSENKKLLEKDEILGISLDLYSGIRMAIDSVQKMGIPVTAKLYDTEANPQKIARILKESNFRNTEFIVGPLLASNIKTVARDLNHLNVAIYSPLSHTEFDKNTNVFQTRPTDEMKEELLISFIDSLHSGKNILILSDQKNTGFANKIKNKFNNTKQIIRANEDFLQKSDLVNQLDTHRPNWIIIATNDYGMISNAFSTLNSVRSQYEIQVFTPHKNRIFDEEVPNEYLSNLKLTFPSIDKADTPLENESFVKAYLAKYGISPNAYAVRGFDITYDALLRSASGSSIFNSLNRQRGITEYVENRFNYIKKPADSYYNNGVFLLQYDENLELRVLN